MKKRGFTLIELLAVIIVLAVVAIVAVPIVLDVVEESRDSANKSTALNILDAGKLYYTESIMDENKKQDIGTGENVYDKLILNGEKPENGKLYISEEGKISLSVVIDNKCYVKSYETELAIYESSAEECNAYVGEDTIKPTISYEAVGTKGNDDWYISGTYVKINVHDVGSGIKSYKWCEGEKCELTNEETTSKSLYYETSKSVVICAQAYDNAGNESEKICSGTYNIDIDAPTAGTILVNGSEPSTNWYSEDLKITVVDGSDLQSGHLKTEVDVKEITESTSGTKVTVTTYDVAGNTSTREYTLKLDKTEPTVTITKDDSTTKLTATVEPQEIPSGYSYKWYKDGNSINVTTNEYTPTETGTYKVEIITGSGKTATSNEIRIDNFTVSYDFNGGTGLIENQTKVEDITLKLTDTKPTKDGYEFLGWGTSSSDKEVDYESGTDYTENESIKLYAIWKKTLTATFIANGATLEGSTTVTCDIYNAEKTCEVKTPNITRDGYSVVGFSTNKEADTKEVSEDTTIEINANITYYAITKKEITVTFYRNGAASLTPKNGSASTKTSIEQKCTMKNEETSCTITSPTITASSNTPTVIGWSTSSSTTTSEWQEASEKTFTADASYYAITKKDAVTYTATFVENGSTLTGNKAPTCTIAATYNGVAQEKTCSVTSPTITREGYIIVGYGTSESDTEAKVLSGASVNISEDTTYIALTKEVVLKLTETTGKSYPGGSNLTVSVDTENSKNYGSLTCSSSNTNVATCTVSGRTITMTPGSTTGSAVITVTESNVGKTAKYTFNNIDQSFAINVTFTADDANYYEDDSIRYWLNKSYYVKVNVTSDETISKIEMCTATTNTCDPTGKASKTGTSGSMNIIAESNNNRVCVQAYDSLGRVSSVKCSEAFGLDTVDPTAGTILVNGEAPSSDWYNEKLTITAVDGKDATSGHLSTSVDTTSITSSISSKTVTVTTKDKAGNESTRTYTLKTDLTTPSVTITKDSSSTKLTATVIPSTTISNYTYKWYKGSSVISGATSSTYVPTTSGTYKVVVTTGAGKTDESNTITISDYTVSYNMNGGSATISSQTKVQDITLKLSTTTPTRTGYEFQGWGTSATDESVDYASGANYTGNSNIELYAIWKKTVTITFDANGATLTGSTSATCDMYNADTSCSVDTPTITRSGFTIVGFNTSSTADTKQVGSNATINVSANTKYYAITTKEVTVTFYRNGAASLTPKNGSASTATSLTQKCTIKNTATNCTITSPTITASSNTPTVVGYATTSGATTSTWASNADKTFTADATYYAITRKAAVTYTAAFNANGAALSSTTTQSCTIAATYNGTAQGTSCTVNAPTITRSGFTITGFNTTSNATTNNSAYSSSTGKITLNSSNTGSTWYAVTSKEVTVTFYRNGAASLTPSGGSATTATSLTQKCTIRNTATSCNVTSPTITASSNTPTVVGYATTSGATTSAWTHNTAKAFSSNASYYAITKAEKITYTATFIANGATLTGNTSPQCTVDEVYNGASRLPFCDVTAPTISREGYIVEGFGTSPEGNVQASSGGTITITSDKTYYAITKQITLTLGSSSGTVSAGSSVTVSVANSNAGTLSCTSSNTNIATCTVSSSALTITGVAPGTVAITVKGSNGGPTPTYSLTVETGYLCIRATSLHKSGSTTYGNTSTTPGSLVSGDAYDCDVNGDGIYDSETERFYYASDYYDASTKTFNSEYAALIYYSNTVGSTIDNISTTTHVSCSNHKASLPTTSQWSNVSLYKTTRPRGVLSGTGSFYTSGTINYDGYAARLLSYKEVEVACNNTNWGVRYDESACGYFAENKSSFWLEDRYMSSYGWYFTWYSSTSTGSIGETYDYDDCDENYGIRPVIDVKKTDMEI